MKAIEPKVSHPAGWAQESAKTDGLCKGPAAQGAGGSDGNVISLGKRGGQEVASEVAKTDGLCK